MVGQQGGQQQQGYSYYSEATYYQSQQNQNTCEFIDSLMSSNGLSRGGLIGLIVLVSVIVAASFSYCCRRRAAHRLAGCCKGTEREKFLSKDDGRPSLLKRVGKIKKPIFDSLRNKKPDADSSIPGMVSLPSSRVIPSSGISLPSSTVIPSRKAGKEDDYSIL